MVPQVLLEQMVLQVYLGLQVYQVQTVLLVHRLQPLELRDYLGHRVNQVQTVPQVQTVTLVLQA